MPIPQRALSLGLTVIRQLNWVWGGLTMRKVILGGIAVAVVIAALKNGLGVFMMLVLPCAMLLLLTWGLARLFGLLGLSKWSENIRVALALAVVVGFFLFCSFMLRLEPRVFRHGEQNAELSAEMQEVRIERNKVGIGMTINDVLLLVRGMDIDASADAAWLSVLPDNKRFYYRPSPLEARQHDDGTFTFSCYCGSPQVSRNSPVTESQAAALVIQQAGPGQYIQNLTVSQTAVLMKQNMSDAFDWSWHYTTGLSWQHKTGFKHSRQYVFTVSFGHDGRVNHISDVDYTDFQNHRT